MKSTVIVRHTHCENISAFCDFCFFGYIIYGLDKEPNNSQIELLLENINEHHWKIAEQILQFYIQAIFNVDHS